MESSGELALRFAGAGDLGCAEGRWPRPDESPTRPGWPGVMKRFKYRLRLLLSQPQRWGFMDFVQGAPVWRELHQHFPDCYYPTLTHFLDRRFSLRERFTVARTDLEQAESRFGRRLARGEQVELWSLSEDCHLMLGINDVSWHEGRWTLSLRDARGQRLYCLSFGFLPCGALLVGSVQGAPGMEEVVRDITKTAEGMRPAWLLFEALRAAAATWGLTALVGIDPLHHIKGRWNLRNRRLCFDYRRFWSEVGAGQREDGYWETSLKPLPRDLSDVPSRKRAMYRRRSRLQLQADLADDGAPAPGVVGHQFAEGRRAAAHGREPLLLQRGAHAGVLQHGVDVGIDALYQRLRRPRRREETVPGQGLHVRVAGLGQRGHVAQGVQPLAAGDGQQPHAA